MLHRLSLHQAYPAFHVGLRLPFVHSAATLCVPHCVGTVGSVVHCHSKRFLLYPRGPRSGPGSVVPVHSLIRPHPPHSKAHSDFAAWRFIRNAFAVLVRLGDPRLVPCFCCTFPLDMPSSTTAGSPLALVESRSAIPAQPNSCRTRCTVRTSSLKLICSIRESCTNITGV